LKVPRAGVGLHEIDAGIGAEAEAGKFEAAGEEAEQAEAGFESPHVGERLDAGAGVFVNGDVFESESGSGEEIDADLTDFDFAAEAVLEGALDLGAEELDVEVGGGDAGEDY